MKEFEVNGVQYLAVEMNPLHRYFEIHSNVLLTCRNKIIADELVRHMVLPEGSWEIVGKTRELSLSDIYFKIFNYKGGYHNPETDSSEEESALISDYQELCIKHNLNDNDLILKRL